MPLLHRMQDLSLALSARMDEAAWLFELKTAGTEIAVCLPNCHDNFPLAALVPGKAAITAMCFDIGGRPERRNIWRSARRAIGAEGVIRHLGETDHDRLLEILWNVS